MRKSRKLMIGCKRKRDKAHRDLRFAIKFTNFENAVYRCRSCVREPICFESLIP